MQHWLFLIVLTLCTVSGKSDDPSELNPSAADVPSRGSAFSQNEYNQLLRAFHEPTLTNRKTGSRDVYRLSWMRSSEPYIVFRLEIAADGGSQLFVTKGSLNEDISKPALITSKSRLKITRSATNNFLRLFAASSFLTRSSNDPHEQLVELDGSEWVMEASVESRYHVTTRSYPLPTESDPRNKSQEEIALDTASLYLILLGRAANEDLY